MNTRSMTPTASGVPTAANSTIDRRADDRRCYLILLCLAVPMLAACEDTTAPIVSPAAELADGTWIGAVSAHDESQHDLGGELQFTLQGSDLTALVRGDSLTVDCIIRTRDGLAMRIYGPNDIEGLFGYDLHGALQGDRLAGQARVWGCFLCGPRQGITIAQGTWHATRAE